MHFPFHTRKKRLSDRLDLLIIGIQVIFLVRMALLITGIWQTAPASFFVQATDVVVRPLYGLIPPAQVGWYVLDTASAVLMIGISVCLVAAEVIADHRRLRRRMVTEKPS